MGELSRCPPCRLPHPSTRRADTWPGQAHWFQAPDVMGFGAYRLSNHGKSLPGPSWFNSAVTTRSISRRSAIGYRVNTALSLTRSLCCFKEHRGVMRGTLMGPDKEWISSFSTWDYLLPAGTQLPTDWRASLCQQAAEGAPLHRRANSLPAPPVTSPECHHRAAPRTGHKPPASLQGKGPNISLGFFFFIPSLSLFLAVMHSVLAFSQSRMLAQLFFFWKNKTKQTNPGAAWSLWETDYPKQGGWAKPLWTVIAAAPKLSLPPQIHRARPKYRNWSLAPTSRAVGRTHLKLFSWGTDRVMPVTQLSGTLSCSLQGCIH